eukprot:6491044-Amphidinium_carterae.5
MVKTSDTIQTGSGTVRQPGRKSEVNPSHKQCNDECANTSMCRAPRDTTNSAKHAFVNAKFLDELVDVGGEVELRFVGHTKELEFRCGGKERVRKNRVGPSR